MREELTEDEAFPRCIVCRSREAHRSEMVNLTRAATTEELRPTQEVFACRECL